MKTLIILFLLIAAQTFTQWQPSRQDLLILFSKGYRPAKHLQMIMKFPFNIAGLCWRRSGMY